MVLQYDNKGFFRGLTALGDTQQAHDYMDAAIVARHYSRNDLADAAVVQEDLLGLLKAYAALEL